MKVLVAYGSERGGTAGIAERIGTTLRERGLDVDVASTDRARDLAPYDAVVLGGALYALHWHQRARRFVQRHAKALREREVWFFSSGPLDDSASRGEIPPTPQVKVLMEHVGARGHVTFGGRLAPDAKGFPASQMAQKNAGDWRDFPRIDAWAREVDAALHAPRPPRAVPRPLPSRALPLALALLSGIAALAIAARLAFDRDDAIAASVVALLVGAPLLAAAWQHLVRGDFASFASLTGGCALAIAAVVVGVTGVVSIAGSIGLAVLALAVIADSIVRMRVIFGEWGEAAKQAPRGPQPA